MRKSIFPHGKEMHELGNFICNKYIHKDANTIINKPSQIKGNATECSTLTASWIE
jgi:hypothetical protein